LVAIPCGGMAFLISCAEGKAIGLPALGLVAPRGAGDPVRDGGFVADGDADIFNFSLLVVRLRSDMAPPSRSLITVSVSEPAPPPTRRRPFNEAEASSIWGAEELGGAGDIGRE